MENFMEKLPDEVLERIIFYAFPCKKSQKFYINKRFLKLTKKKIDKCIKINMLNQDICVGCHPNVLKFLKGYSYLFY